MNTPVPAPEPNGFEVGYTERATSVAEGVTEFVDSRTVSVPEPELTALAAHFNPAPGIPVDDARTFLRWAGSRYGRTGGRFKDLLLLAVFAADADYLDGLRVIVPGLVAAVELYRTDQYWLEKLEQSVRAAEVSE